MNDHKEKTKISLYWLIIICNLFIQYDINYQHDDAEF